VTIEAIGCQKAIATATIGRNADYLLALKDNHPTLCEGMQDLLARLGEAGFDDSRVDVCEVAGKREHGPLERRTVFATSDLSALTATSGWSNLTSVAMVRREREVNGKTSVEDAYYLTNLARDAETIERRVGSHWRIENTLHGTL
jgi:predicted transposase YbfD/YdcC